MAPSAPETGRPAGFVPCPAGWRGGRSRPGRGGGLCEDFVAGGGPGCRKRGPCGAHERSYTPVRPDGAQAPGGSRRLQGWGPRSGGGAWVCVGGACLVLGGRAARGSAQPPSGGGLPGAELSRLGLRALAGAAVWEQSVLQEFRPRPGAGALRCPHPPRPCPLPTSQASFQFGGVEVAIST